MTKISLSKLTEQMWRDPIITKEKEKNGRRDEGGLG